MERREPDMLDEITAEEAKTDPRAAQDWETMKVVARIAKARKERGLSQGDIATRMGIPQQRVAEIEKRPWSASFGRVVAYARAVGIEVGVVGDLAASP